jgi:gas vesicle protein
MMDTQEKFLWGAVIGSAIGAAAALMLTPFSGEKLRKKIINGLGYPPKELKKKMPQTSSHRSHTSHPHSEKKRPAKAHKKAAARSKEHSHRPTHG